MVQERRKPGREPRNIYFASWCPYDPNLFCQEEAGCANCEIAPRQVEPAVVLENGVAYCQRCRRAMVQPPGGRRRYCPECAAARMRERGRYGRQKQLAARAVFSRKTAVAPELAL